ncbi:MAG: hypothetical protein IPJ76_11265 [Flavobacteriales bacterium]|nr:MAG: hypothetical protein IPJ76_11265 [Flavobacteriales bacterium]
MKRAITRILVLIALLGGGALAGYAQEGISKKEAEKMQARKEKDEKKAAKKAEKEKQKRHLGIQDKATRKRIKQHTKRAGKHGTNMHRDPFFVRLFGRRH